MITLVIVYIVSILGLEYMSRRDGLGVSEMIDIQCIDDIFPVLIVLVSSPIFLVWAIKETLQGDKQWD